MLIDLRLCVHRPRVVKAGLGFAFAVFGVRAEGVVELFLFVPRRVSGNQIGDAGIEAAQNRQVIADEDVAVIAVHLRHKCVQLAGLPNILKEKLLNLYIPIF